MKEFVSFVADPIIIALFGALLGLAVYAVRRSWGTTIMLLAVFQLWFFSAPLFVGLLSGGLERNVYTYSINSSEYGQDNISIDYVFIMGGGHLKYSDNPTLDYFAAPSIRRLVEGREIAKLHSQAHVITSGYGAHAKLAAGALADMGIAPERIIMNKKVHNTQSEINSILALMEEGVVSRGANIIIVSTANHIPRIKIWAKHYGLFPLYSGVGFVANGYKLETGWDYLLALVPRAEYQALSYGIIHEYLGIVHARYLILAERWLG